MKKLICALVLLAMLVPVTAMAEEMLPNSLKADEMANQEVKVNGTEINLQVDVQGYKARYKLDLPGDNVTYTAYYYLTGALESSMIIYKHQSGPACVAEFGPTGVAEMIDHICDAPHDFTTAPAKVDKLASGKDANKPEENVSIVADAYEWEGDDFLTAIKEAYDKASESFEGNGIVPIENSPFSVSYMNGQKMLVHFGPIAYGAGTESEVNLRVFGDTNKNTLFWANYSTSDGSLKEYGMFSEDGRTLTVYDDKNRLQSTEFWTTDGEYWEYFDGKWSHSTTGSYLDAVPDTPDGDVLKLITVAPRPATFKLDNSQGTPMVPDGVAAETVVTMENSQTTRFDMSTIGTENLTQPITLVLPYGPGQNQALAENFTYTVEHKPDGKPAETYSTDPTSASQIKMAFTPDGIQLSNVKSFSPFTVTWGPEQASTVGMDSLPSTGDNSNLLAYACLLLSSAAMLVMLRRRAHQ